MRVPHFVVLDALADTYRGLMCFINRGSGADWERIFAFAKKLPIAFKEFRTVENFISVVT